MRHHLLALASVSCIACGDNLAVPDYGVSGGTRLEPRFLDAGAGARVVRGWFDRELRVECFFDVATDGRIRCLPSQANLPAVFGDAACTRPLTISPACAPVPTFAFGPSRATPHCGRSLSQPVQEVGAVHAGSVFRKDFIDGCVPQGVAPGDRAYELGVERDPTEFVGATLVAEGDARVVPYALVGDDGSKLLDGIWDTQRNGECGPTGSSELCAPVEIALHYDFMFSDAECTKNDAAIDLSDARPCHPPTAVLGNGSQLREIGAQIPVGSAYRRDSAGGTCTPEIPYDDETYWVEGAPIALESLASLSRVLDGNGRVRAERWIDGAGQSLAVAKSFFDTDLKEACSPRVFADGVRCAVSSAAQFGDGFLDAACKTPIMAWSGEKPRFGYMVHHAANDCDHVEFDAAYEVGDAVAADTYFVKGQTGCTSAPVSMGTTLYKLGAKIDPPEIAR